MSATIHLEYSVHVKGTPTRTDKYGMEWTKQNVVAFRGPCQCERLSDEVGVPSYVGDVLVDPTWGDLFREAKRAAKVTQDRHHIYFEGAHVVSTSRDGVKLLRLSMGS